MKKQRPYVLSIAGYDPSGGAGVLADIKTFEQIGVYGFAVSTCITYQTDSKFKGLKWLDKKEIPSSKEIAAAAKMMNFKKRPDSFAFPKRVIELLAEYKSFEHQQTLTKKDTNS